MEDGGLITIEQLASQAGSQPGRQASKQASRHGHGTADAFQRDGSLFGVGHYRQAG
jgi:hypothetical protein